MGTGRGRGQMQNIEDGYGDVGPLPSPPLPILIPNFCNSCNCESASNGRARNGNVRLCSYYFDQNVRNKFCELGLFCDSFAEASVGAINLLVKTITYNAGILMLYHQELITKLCGSVPESIILNCSLGMCGWPSRSTRSHRESFKFSQGFLSNDEISEIIKRCVTWGL